MLPHGIKTLHNESYTPNSFETSIKFCNANGLNFLLGTAATHIITAIEQVDRRDNMITLETAVLFLEAEKRAIENDTRQVTPLERPSWMSADRLKNLMNIPKSDTVIILYEILHMITLANTWDNDVALFWVLSAINTIEEITNSL